jgi:hypothetical protein
MITFKTLSIEELKKDYLNRHGFVFQAGTTSSDKAIEHLCNTLIQHNITKELPDFVVRLNDTTTAFVYKDDFDGPSFFQNAMVATQMGVCRIETLHLALMSQQ